MGEALYMSTATDSAFAQATDSLDDNLQPLEGVEDKKPDEPETPPTPAPETPEEGKDTKDAKDKDGFTADELEEVTPTPEEIPAPTPTETTPISTDGMDAETKYIVDNLPFITARIKDGDTVKEVQIKSWTQLPEDVQFATKRDELAFVNAVSAQENRAVQLQSKFQQDQQVSQNQQFEEREDAMIRDDVADLQREGELAKFKTKMDDAEFEKDPATQEVQKVLDYMENRNKQYLAEYNQGRPFRHIGFREAFYMYQRTETPKDAQRQEDKERKDLAQHITGNRGLVASELKKPTVRPGTTIQDILNRIDTEW